MYEELLLMLRSQHRDIAELRQSQLELLQRLTGHIDSVESTVMVHMVSQQEQQRILPPGGAHATHTATRHKAKPVGRES